MPRVTIYVPDDLKARMDEVGDQVVWSNLAQRAFEVEIHHQRCRAAGEKTMEAVIERLRASKKMTEDSERAAGQDAGVRWAREDAGYDELKRVAELDSEWRADVEGAVLGDDADSYQTDEFWRACAGTDEPSESFVEGFVRGARQIWDEVASKL